MRHIPERDWKVFRDLHGVLIKRFCERALTEAARLATNPQNDPSERFAKVHKLLRDRQKDLHDLGDHRRSTAFMVIARMYHGEELFLPDEFERFSQEFRDQIIGIGGLWKG